MKRSYDNRFWRDENPRNYRPRSGFRGKYPGQRPREAYNMHQRNPYQWSNGPRPPAQFGPRMRQLPIFHEDVSAAGPHYQPKNRHDNRNFAADPSHMGPRHPPPLLTRNHEMNRLDRPYYSNEFQDRRKSSEDFRHRHTEHHDQALYDTVDIVKKKLSDRKNRSGNSVNNNSDTYVLSSYDQEKTTGTASLSESGDISQKIFTRRPNQSIPKLVRERVTTRENCENMKSKIVQQLLRMDKSALQKLISNPRPSSKFECVIHSLLPEYRDSLNRDLRNKAEKSLMHEMNEQTIKSEEMYEDTFMSQMRGLLDPEDTVIISDIKPILMAQLKKTLQTDNFHDDGDFLTTNSSFEVQSNDHYPTREISPCENYNPIEAPAQLLTQEFPGHVDKLDEIASLENFEPDAVVNSGVDEQETYTAKSPSHVDQSSDLTEATNEQEQTAPPIIEDDFEDCGHFQFSEEETRIDRRHTIFNKSININEYLRRSNSKEYDNFDDNFTGLVSCSNIKKEQNSTPSDNPLSDSLADFIIENIDHVNIETKPVFFNDEPSQFSEEELKDPVPINSKKPSSVSNFVAHKEIAQLEVEKSHIAAPIEGPKTKKNTYKKTNKGKAQKHNKVVGEIIKMNKKTDSGIQSKKLKPNSKQLDKKNATVHSKQFKSLLKSKKGVQNTANHSSIKSTKEDASIVNPTYTKSPSKTTLNESISKLVTIDMFQKVPKTKSDAPKNVTPRVRVKGKPVKQLQLSEVPIKETSEHTEEKCRCSQIPDTKSQHCQTDNVKDSCILCELLHRQTSKQNPPTRDEIFDWIKMIDKVIPELMQKKLSLFNKLPKNLQSKASGMGEFGMTLVNFKTPQLVRVEKKALTDKTISHTDTLLKSQQIGLPIRSYSKKKKDIEPHILCISKKKLKGTKKNNKNKRKNAQRILVDSDSNQKDIITKPCFVKLIKLDIATINDKSIDNAESFVQPTVEVAEVNSYNLCEDISGRSEDLNNICNADEANDLCGIIDLNEIVDLDNFTDLGALTLDVHDDAIIADVDIEAITEEVVGDIHDSGMDESCHQSPEDVAEPVEIKIYNYTSEELSSDCITVAGHIDGILAIEVVNNNFLASCVDGNIYYFNGADGHMIRTLRGYNLPVTCMIVVEGADKTTVYSGSLDSRIRSYNLEAGIECSPECNVLSPILTMDKAWDTLFVGTTTGFVLQFECKNNTLIPVSSMKFSEQNIMCLRAVPEGSRRVLLVGSRLGHVSVHDAQSGLLLRILEAPKATVYSLLCDGNKVICATNSPQMQIYDYTSGVHIGVHNSLRGCTCMRSAGGLLFAGGMDGCVYVYRGQAEPLAQLRGPAILLTSLAIIDCRVIAAYKDRSLFIWKLPPSVLQEMIL